MSAVTTTKLPLAAQKTLWKAVSILERESFVARLSDLTGEPVMHVLRQLPAAVTRRINQAVQGALHKSLEVALYKLGSDFPEPDAGAFRVMSGITGGIGGFFGLATLTVELPVTTTLMLRSIATIARRHGEDLSLPASRLACLEVFALGPKGRNSRRDASPDATYYAVRTFLARSVNQAAETLAERGIAQTSAPVIVDLVAAIGSRFGLVVSEKVAAGAIPIMGAIGGAAVNLAFMAHFQKLAHGHFAVRRLERVYGEDEVMRMYEAYALYLEQGKREGIS